MARKITQLVTGNIYHIVTRGNAQQDIFFKESDYFRMVKDLYEFNDENTIDTRYRVMGSSLKMTGSDPVIFGKRIRIKRKRKLLVEILAFCLMPNHMHLLVRQLQDGGISDFMKKIKGGYAAYINKKYERTGSLFQSHFKAVEIESDEQLNIIFSYIHTNPCQLVDPGWKEAGVRNRTKAMAKLKSHRWSSYLDYTGKKNFPSLTNRSLFTELYRGARGCRGVVEDWVSHKAEAYEDIKHIVLE